MALTAWAAYVAAAPAKPPALGMTPAQMAFWDATFTGMTKAEAWKQDLAKNYWGDNYINSSQARSYLDREYKDFRNILGDLGLAK